MKILSVAQSGLAVMWGQRPNGGGPYPIFDNRRTARVRGSFCSQSYVICAHYSINLTRATMNRVTIGIDRSFDRAAGHGGELSVEAMFFDILMLNRVIRDF